MTIDWWTLALQAINFLALVWLLRRFLFEPVLGVIERRREESLRAHDEAAAAHREAKAEAAAYREKLAAIDTEREAMRRSAFAEIEAERARRLQQAEAEAGERLAHGRRLLAEERTAALTELRTRAADLATALAERLLREVAAVPFGQVFLERVEERIAGLPEAERRRLVARDGRGQPVAVRVAIWPALDAAAEGRWRARLQTHLGGNCAIQFEPNPVLIAGARIDLASTTLEASWRDALARAQAAVLADAPAR
jgi:F-type H+-transporting ATPase subunit b